MDANAGLPKETTGEDAVIYFMQPVDGGPVKIGFSDNVPGRQKALESMFGRKMNLLATTEGTKVRESEIHRQFAHLRFDGTEQFRPTLELAQFIGCDMHSIDEGSEIEAMRPVRSQGTLVRVSSEFADAIRDLANVELKSIAEVCDEFLYGLVRNQYKESLMSELRRLEQEDAMIRKEQDP